MYFCAERRTRLERKPMIATAKAVFRNFGARDHSGKIEING